MCACLCLRLFACVCVSVCVMCVRACVVLFVCLVCAFARLCACVRGGLRDWLRAFVSMYGFVCACVCSRACLIEFACV